MIEKLVVSCKTGEIMECNYTEEEKQAMEQQKQEQLLNPVIEEEPQDYEKVAMAEAIIDLTNEIEFLKSEINELKIGGNV